MNKKNEKIEEIPIIAESIATQESLVHSVQRSTFVSLLSVLVAAGSIVISLMVVYSTHDKYFTVSPQGVITQLVALDKALVTDEVSRKFSRDFAMTLYSISYNNFRQKIENIESMFYAKSFDNFIIEFEDTLKFIKKNKLYAHALIDLPVLIKRAKHNGRMKWKFEVPITVYYEGVSGQKYTQKVIATIVIQRTDNRKKIGGVEVFSFITETQEVKNKI
ncbi:hypothetical protein BSPLISOX_652 [uncultured Gammaproteobacteria bacterium]|jgi:hypothetical protein|nr:hypothetical protein BSPLISOX_652 [uncultured Gammaproteobacteria bacterium]